MTRPLTVATLLIATAYSACADDGDLAVIRASYRQSVTSITSASCRFDATTRLMVQPEASGPFGYQRHDVRWALDGEKRVFHQTRVEGGRGPGAVLFFSRDDEHQWLYLTRPDGKLHGPLRKTPLQSADENLFRQEVTPEHFLGRFINYSNHPIGRESLSTLLDRPDTQVNGREAVLEHDCWKVDLGTHVAGSRAVQMAAWFDPSVGYLPRQIVIRSRNLAADANGIWKERVMQVREFSSEGVTGSLWFPVLVEIESTLGRKEFKVTELSVNKPIPKALFRPSTDLQ